MQRASAGWRTKGAEPVQPVRHQSPASAILLWLLLLSLRCLTVPFTASASSVTSQASGNWESIKTWAGGAIPRSSDTAVIRAGDTVTVTSNAFAANVTFNASSSSTATLSINAGANLTLSSTLTLMNSGNTDSAANLTGAGKLTCDSVQVGGSTSPSSSATCNATLTCTLTNVTLTGNLTVAGLKSGNRYNNAQLLLNSGQWSVGGATFLTANGAMATLSLTNGDASASLEIVGSKGISSSGTVVAALDGGTATVIYSGADQPVYPVSYCNLMLAGSGIKTLTSVSNVTGNLDLSGTASATLATSLKVGGNLTVGTGATLDCGAGNYSLLLGGGWKSTGNFVRRAGTVFFGGTNLQTVSSSTLFNHLTVSNSAGLALAASPVIDGLFTLARGQVFAETNALTIGTNGTVAGASASSFVRGTVQKILGITGSGQAFTFPIGDSSAFTPVALSNLTVYKPGQISARSTRGDHPQLTSSGFDLPRCVHRYWTLTNANGLGASFNASFSYPSSDLDPKAVASGLWARRYSGSSWTNSVVTGTPTSTNLTIAGESAFGDFALGEILNNSAPVAGTVTVARYPRQGVKFSVASILAQAFDAQGDALTFSIATATTNGATVSVVGGWVFYTPAAGFTNDDTFSYTLADPRGATATGQIRIEVHTDTQPGQNLLAENLGGGRWLLCGSGIPGRAFRPQYSHSGLSPTWHATSVPFTTPDSSGAFRLELFLPADLPVADFRILYPGF